MNNLPFNQSAIEELQMYYSNELQMYYSNELIFFSMM